MLLASLAHLKRGRKRENNNDKSNRLISTSKTLNMQHTISQDFFAVIALLTLSCQTCKIEMAKRSSLHQLAIVAISMSSRGIPIHRLNSYSSYNPFLLKFHTCNPLILRLPIFDYILYLNLFSLTFLKSTHAFTLLYTSSLEQREYSLFEKLEHGLLYMLFLENFEILKQAN